MAIIDPTRSAKENNRSSKEATAHLAQALQNKTTWDIDTHHETMIEAKKEHKQRKRLEDESQLQDCLIKQSSLGKKVIARASDTGAWLSATPNTLAGTELGKDEWRDSACCRYNMRPESIPKYCDGCGKEATIDHILN